MRHSRVLVLNDFKMAQNIFFSLLELGAIF